VTKFTDVSYQIFKTIFHLPMILSTTESYAETLESNNRY